MADRSIDALIKQLLEDEGSEDDLIAAIAGASLDVHLDLLLRSEERVRRAAVLAARRRTEPEILAAVARRHSDVSAIVRAAVAEIAATVPSLLTDAEVDKLLGDEDGAVRAAAALASRGRLALEAKLIAMLQDAAWRARMEAARALVETRRPEVFASLIERVATDADDDVRKASATTAAAMLGRTWPEPLAWPPIPTLKKARTNLEPLKGTHGPLVAAALGVLEREVDIDALREQGVLLTDDLAAGKLPRSFGVDVVCDAILRVLTGDGPRAAVVLGDPGVGKTAVVHELTRRLAEDPGGPWIVLQVAPGEFVSGTKYTGEWETKVAKLVELIRAPKRVLLYVPNLEQLAQVGTWSKSDVNVASMLAPHAERGTIALLGESTTEAFRTGLGAIPSIRRIFTAFDIPAATPEETRAVLQAIAEDDGSPASASAYDRLVELSAFYLTGASEPGRSASVLRRVLASDGPWRRTASRAEGEGTWGERDVLAVLSATTGIPTAILDDSVPLDRQAARAFLEERVMGQREAVDALVDLVTLVKAGLTDPEKPLGVLLFVGPTGVGKTELARSLAELLFGDPNRLVRFDMSEFATYEAFERLIGKTGGAPGLLTEAAREHPFSVVLLDEIEKSHLNVFDLCLQIFDAGRLTDVRGRTADFRRMIIILTSNVGSRVEREGPVGFGRGGPKLPDRESTSRELGRVFRPEFLNRIDRIVTFRPLDEETASRIARRELARVLVRSGIRRRRLTVDAGDDVLSLLLREGYSIAFGARPLKRTVERLVLLPLARAIASGAVTDGSILRLRARGDRLDVETVSVEEEAEIAARAGESPASPVSPERGLFARSEALATRIEALREQSAPLEEEKARLVERLAAPGGERAPKATLDALYRIDGVLGALGELEQGVRASVSGAKVLADLERRAEHLEVLLRSTSADRLADVFIELRSVSSQGEALGAVERLARMYLGFGARHGFAVTVLDDQQGGDPPEDAVVLLVSGPGAQAWLEGEAGLHEVTRGTKPPRDAKGRRVREDDEARPSDREVVRATVFAAPVSLEPFGRDEARVDVRPLTRAHARLARPRFQITLVHLASMAAMHVWSETRTPAALAQLGVLLRARVTAEGGQGPATLVRRYALGPTAFVRDFRTGRRTSKVERVLEGRIEMFLRPSSEDRA